MLTLSCVGIPTVYSLRIVSLYRIVMCIMVKVVEGK